MRRRLPAVALALALVCGMAACSGGEEPEARARTTVTTTARRTTTTTAPTWRRQVGLATIPVVAVFASPTDPTPTWTLSNPTREGYRLSFLLDGAAPDGWLRVSVPARPNNSFGFIRPGDVELHDVTTRIQIAVGERRLRFWDGDQLLLDETVAVGTPRTPTPLGHFFVDVVAETGQPRGVYGPFQVSVTAFSEVFRTFGGGVGQMAIHGTNRPDLLGQAVSNGCVRMRNDAITVLADRVQTGTPVEIVA